MTVMKTAAQHLAELEELIQYNVKQAQENPNAVLTNTEPDLSMGSADAEKNRTVKKDEFDPNDPNIKPDPKISEEYKQASSLATKILNDMKREGEENKKREEIEEPSTPEEKKASVKLYKIGSEVAVAAIKDASIIKDATDLRKLGYCTAITSFEKLSADIAALRPQLETLVIQKILTEAEKADIEKLLGEAQNVDEKLIEQVSKGNSDVKKTLESIYMGENIPNKKMNPETLDAKTEKVAWLKNWGF